MRLRGVTVDIAAAMSAACLDNCSYQAHLVSARSIQTVVLNHNVYQLCVQL
jgi:hypothetical protein